MKPWVSIMHPQTEIKLCYWILFHNDMKINVATNRLVEIVPSCPSGLLSRGQSVYCPNERTKWVKRAHDLPKQAHELEKGIPRDHSGASYRSDLFTLQQNSSVVLCRFRFSTDSILKEATGRLVCSSPSFVSFKVALFAHFEMYLLGAPGFPKKTGQDRFSRPDEPFFVP